MRKKCCWFKLCLYGQHQYSAVNCCEPLVFPTPFPKYSLYRSLPSACITNIPLCTNPAQSQGLKCIVRYAHEMNGAWYPWAQQPVEYIPSYRLVSTAIKTQTKSTAMAWTPNVWWIPVRGWRVSQPLRFRPQMQKYRAGRLFC